MQDNKQMVEFSNILNLYLVPIKFEGKYKEMITEKTNKNSVKSDILFGTDKIRGKIQGKEKEKVREIRISLNLIYYFYLILQTHFYLF